MAQVARIDLRWEQLLGLTLLGMLGAPGLMGAAAHAAAPRSLLQRTSAAARPAVARRRAGVGPVLVAAPAPAEPEVRPPHPPPLTRSAPRAASTRRRCTEPPQASLCASLCPSLTRACPPAPAAGCGGLRCRAQPRVASRHPAHLWREGKRRLQRCRHVFARFAHA